MKIQFTQDGHPIGEPIPAPEGANDIKVLWARQGIVRAWWTRNCQPLWPPIAVPKGANDAHLEVGKELPQRRVLKERMRGDDVARLQDDLDVVGYEIGDPVGVFGPDTTTAVKAVQQSLRLTPNGIVSEETARALETATIDGVIAQTELRPDDMRLFLQLSFKAAVQDEGPRHREWRDRLRRAFARRLREEGITEDEIEKILVDTFFGFFGIRGALRNLYKQWRRIRAALRAFDKAKKDAGPEPPFNQ